MTTEIGWGLLRLSWWYPLRIRRYRKLYSWVVVSSYDFYVITCSSVIFRIRSQGSVEIRYGTHTHVSIRVCTYVFVWMFVGEGLCYMSRKLKLQFRVEETLSTKLLLVVVTKGKEDWGKLHGWEMGELEKFEETNNK